MYLHEMLPKYVLPEWTMFEDGKGFRICLKDIRDDYSFDCQAYTLDEKITSDMVRQLTWGDYVPLLIRENVL